MLASLDEVAEVAGYAAQAQHAGLLVQHAHDFLQRQVLLMGDILDDAGVEAAGASAHHEALQRRKTHGGIHRLTIADGGDGSAVTQMAHDHAGIAAVQTCQLMETLGDELMAGAVETVAAHLVLLIVLVGHTVEVSLGRHGLMERGIKHTHHRHAGHNGLAGADADEGSGIVEGSEVGALLHLGDHLIGDDHGGGKLLAAVDETVTHSLDLIEGGDDAVLLIGESRQHLGDGGLMIGQGIGHDDLIVTGGGVVEDTINADTLAQTGGQHALGLGVDQLILQRATAAVHNQDFHIVSPLKLIRI